MSELPSQKELDKELKLTASLPIYRRFNSRYLRAKQIPKRQLRIATKKLDDFIIKNKEMGS